MSLSQKLKSKKKNIPARKSAVRKKTGASPKSAKTKLKKVTSSSKSKSSDHAPQAMPVIRAEDWAAVWKESLSDNEDEEWMSGKI